MSTYRALFTAVVLATIPVSVGALPQTVPGSAPELQSLSDADPVSWARPKVVVAPEYPADALEKKITGYVDADVLVREDGVVGEIRSLSSTPKNEDFEKAVAEVIKLWVFHTPMSNCRPYETVGNVRIWFDLKDGAGTVSVSNRVSVPDPAAKAGPPKSKVVSSNAKELRATVRYPARARRANSQGHVNLIFAAEPDGSISKIDVAYSISKPSGYEKDFIAASKAAVAQFKINAMPDRDKAVAVCVPFNFYLR